MASGWTNCPESVRTQVEQFCTALQEALADNLIGIYLHGSLAMGGFNPQASDIDLLVAVGESMSVDTKRRVAEWVLRFSNTPRPIEITFVTGDALAAGAFPVAFDFHYGEEWRQELQEQMTTGTWRRWNDVQRHDPDLAGQIVVTKARGICLYGQPVARILPSVPSSVLRDCFVEDCEWAFARLTDNPVYGVLNPCRTYAFVVTGSLLSKEEAGTWALQYLPEPYRRLVDLALRVYRGTTKEGYFDPAALEQFAAYIRRHLR